MTPLPWAGMKRALRGVALQKIKGLLKKAFTPVTIMLIPHSDAKSLRLKIPSVGVIASVILWIIGTGYVCSLAMNAFEYQKMKQKLDYYNEQFTEVRSTIASLKESEDQFKKLFSLNSKEQVLKNLDATDTGSVDLEDLKKQIMITMENVGSIKDYLSEQRNVYVATPKGWPVNGHITSPFGERTQPITGKDEFHSGVDIADEPGSPVRATADGVVSFAGWRGPNGNLVVIEHGLGFSTFYAHNRLVAVKVGQKVRRGDVISYLGSTGKSTGPHVHYEVWYKGKAVNPAKYLTGRS
jgi:murein DD-endopeptidase MepM/ murein hydrolase activator NlpD